MVILIYTIITSGSCSHVEHVEDVDECFEMKSLVVENLSLVYKEDNLV